ncbi:MAG: PD-(D/E)XK nuclease family protein [Clostridiales bacterium]|nr:PD-(D/E)XK nuclease family protein [Clostridiales bacterium]
MSRLDLYLGRANTDKTDSLYNAVLSHFQSGDRTYLVVPKQATFAAERRLMAASEGGMFGISVLSLDRLCDEILKSSGSPLPYLSEQGMSMATRRIAETNAGSLRAFSGAIHRQGFCSELSALISTMKRASIRPDDLASAMDRLGDGTILKDKLTDILLLYRESDSYLDSRFLTEDDRILSAIRYLPSSSLAGAHVFFDELPEMTGLFYQFLQSLLETAASVTIGITDDPSGADDELFKTVRMAEREIRNRAMESGVPVRIERFYRSPQHDKALLHLEKHFFSYPYAPYHLSTDRLHVISAPGYQAEADAVCDSVIRQVKKGLRYRDIAVIVTEPDTYETALARSLGLRGIPYFLDSKKPLLSHPAANLVQAALAAISEKYAAPEMLELAKSGFAGLTREEADAFDNYVLRYAVRGGRFLSAFRGKDVPPEAESARVKLTVPLQKLRESLHGRTVREKLQALYGYLIDISLPQQLEQRSAELIAAGMPREAAEHAELWKLMTDLFDQLYVILGDTPMSREDFLSLIREGLSGVRMGVIPDTADRVLIGDTERTRLPDNIRVLYVMGATDGLLPKSRYDDGIIDNGELALLENAGLTVWQRTDLGSANDLLNLYQLFSAPSDELYLTFSQSGGSNELIPSPFVRRMKEMFHVPVTQAETGGSSVPVCEKTGLRMLSEYLREDTKNGSYGPVTAALLDYYRKSPEYGELTDELEKASTGKISPAPLGTALSEELYGRVLNMAPTRLEKFNACPFRHFLEAGLGAKKRPEASVGAPEAGTFYHAMLDAFLNQCQKDGIDLKTVTDEQIGLIVEQITPQVLASDPDRVLETNERAAAELFIMVENAAQCIRALVLQYKSGSFRPYGSEIRFGDGCVFPAITLDLGNGRTAKLHGIIDRIDTVSDGDQQFARVVDYKTHGKKFDYGAIMDGISLQLPLYLQAVAAVSKDPQGVMRRLRPSGGYYMPVIAAPSKDEDEENPVPELKLEGLTVSDPFIIESTEENIDKKSRILKNVKRGKNGTLSGSLCSYGEMDHLLKEAVRISEETTRKILSGDVRISPIDGNCTYCDFKSVCRFDKRLGTCRTRKKKKVKQEQFFESGGKEDAEYGME